MLKVSIVTISFNQARFLERTIQSVLSQDYSNLEYIVVDAGSTDGSRELIQGYEPRIARTILEPDNGPADGLNKGFAAATGEIYGFLNSDDTLASDAVSRAVEFLQNHPDVDVVSGHARIIGPDDKVLRLAYSDRMSIWRYIHGGAALIQPSTFFRRGAYERTRGFNTDNCVYWDGELFLDMACAGCRFARSDEIWSGFRLHEESITSSKRLRQKGNEVMDNLFCRIAGRRRNGWDKQMVVAHKLWRHLLNPRDTMERILRGPVFGRRLG